LLLQEKPKEKFVIGGENKTQSAESALDRIRKKLASKKEPVKQEYDLSVPQSHVASEYYTQVVYSNNKWFSCSCPDTLKKDEMVQFRKTSDGTKKKKLRKKKKKDSDEVTVLLSYDFTDELLTTICLNRQTFLTEEKRRCQRSC